MVWNWNYFLTTWQNMGRTASSTGGRQLESLTSVCTQFIFSSSSCSRISFFVCPPASSLPIDQITTELQAASLVNVSPSSVRMTGPTHQRICCFAVNDSTPTQPVLLKGFHASGSGGCFRVLTNARPAKAGAWVGLSGASVSECVCLCLLSVLLKANGFS